MDNQEKIIDKLQKIEIAIAVTHEKISNLSKLEGANKETLEKIESRVDRHDKIVGAIAIAVSILAVLVKFKII